MESYLCMCFIKECATHTDLEKLVITTLFQITNYCKPVSPWKFSYFNYCKRLGLKPSCIFQVPK